jgi:hypothetical protein
MLIGSGLQALATSGKFKPVALGQIRTAGNTADSSNASKSTPKKIGINLLSKKGNFGYHPPLTGQQWCFLVDYSPSCYCVLPAMFAFTKAMATSSDYAPPYTPPYAPPLG